METIDKLQTLGYIVKTKPSTAIYEPFTSDITGEQYLREISYSTKTNDIKFLKKCLEDLVK
jgi:hypothetical protein